MYVFAVYALHARILLTFEPTRDITVSRRGTLTVGYVQGSVSSVSCCRRSCSACSLADLRGWSAFLKTVMRFLCFASRSSSLSHYHNPDFTGWWLHLDPLSLLPFSRQSPTSFFLTLLTILHHFDVATMRPLAPLQRWIL